MSDAAQKPMEHDAADLRPECDCSAGKTCPLKGVIDSTFKPHYRGQMIELVRTVINAASDPNHDSTGDTKRVKNLKNEMDVVFDERFDERLYYRQRLNLHNHQKNSGCDER